MAKFRIQLLGQFAAWRDETLITSLESAKARELFCYLLLHRHRTHPREILVEVLWSDNSATQARKSLRQALWQLHTALHPGGESRDDEVLTAEGDTISVNPHADLWLDIDMLERAYAQARGQEGRELDPPCFDLLRSAADLYRDDLLTGWYQDWCLSERERLQNIYLHLLDKLMGFAEAGRLFEDGIHYGNRILQVDRARERTHAALMRAHYLAGDRTAALRQYERCVAALAEDLGVRPARRTTALYEQMCADLAAPATAAPAGGPWQRLLDQLQTLETSLDAVRQQVQQVQHDLHSLRKATGRPH